MGAKTIYKTTIPATGGLAETIQHPPCHRRPERGSGEVANLKENLHNKSYMQNSVAILLFSASWGIWWSFFQLWLTKSEADGA